MTKLIVFVFLIDAWIILIIHGMKMLSMLFRLAFLIQISSGALFTTLARGFQILHQLMVY